MNVLLCCLLVNAPPEQFTVFTSGAEGFASIRIPALAVTKSGALLALAEGRAKAADQAQNKIVLKRSTDGGRTWSKLQVLADDGAHSLNNPTVVVEQTTGRVLVMYQRIPGHLKEHSKETATGYEGPNVYHSFVLTSDDEGVTWSAPRNVTRGVKHPTGATTIASGPGVGIQLARGEHQGRLIIPFNEGPFGQWSVYAAWSDDRGETWHYGENVPDGYLVDEHGVKHGKLNEVQMVELSDGTVRLNSRTGAGARFRKTALSRDGGATWTPATDVPELPEPACQASIIRWQDKLLFSGPLGAKRAHGTLHLSRDDGQTWPVQRELVPGFFAYSVLGVLADGSLGCLYEADGYKHIKLARIPAAWVEGG